MLILSDRNWDKDLLSKIATDELPLKLAYLLKALILHFKQFGLPPAATAEYLNLIMDNDCEKFQIGRDVYQIVAFVPDPPSTDPGFFQLIRTAPNGKVTFLS